MNKDDFIKITKSLYQLTLLFPKKEPLRYKIRELADEILSKLTLASCSNPNRPKNLISDIEKNLEVINSFFEVVKSQNWVSPSEILNIQQEYIKLKEEIKNTTKPEILPVNYPQRENYNIIQVQQTSSRQEKILTFLKEKERLQVKDLKNVFPEISKRTLRRDFEQLLKKGLVVRMGEKNNTFYQVS